MTNYCLLPQAAPLPQFWQWHLTPILCPAARQGHRNPPAAVLMSLPLLFLEVLEPSSATQTGILEGLQWVLYKLKKQN